MTQEQKTKISEHFDELHTVVSNYGLNVPNDINDALRAAYLAGADYALDIYCPRWKSVEDELPKDSERVLCVTATGWVYVDFYSRTKYGNMWFQPVRIPTHWMPLPSPPEEGGEG